MALPDMSLSLSLSLKPGDHFHVNYANPQSSKAGCWQMTRKSKGRSTIVGISCFMATIAFHAGTIAAEFGVPQGGGRLPTIALVECLAEEHSRGTGEYCRTTYTRSPTRDGTEVSGTLWEGLIHHDGRRVTSGEDPIAFERSCVLTVEDDAKITYYTAYRPDGKEGEIKGFTKTGSTTHTETMGSFTVSPDNMLAQFLSHNAVRANTLEDWIERVCRSVEDDDEHARCRLRNDRSGFYLEGIPATRKTGCYVEIKVVADIRNQPRQEEWLPGLVRDWSDRVWTECESADESG